jgi:hypothetical protein
MKIHRVNYTIAGLNLHGWASESFCSTQTDLRGERAAAHLIRFWPLQPVKIHQSC